MTSCGLCHAEIPAVAPADHSEGRRLRWQTIVRHVVAGLRDAKGAAAKIGAPIVPPLLAESARHRSDGPCAERKGGTARYEFNR